jgi:hypothetical protein
VSELGLAEHREVAVVEHQLEHFGNSGEGLVLVVADHIFGEALPASCPDNDVHMDQFVAADLDHGDA